MADDTREVEDKGKELSTSTGTVRLWLKAIEAASDEEKTWRATAQDAVNIYRAEDEQHAQTHFNILHSNVETIIPAIYNSTPSPDIRRRFNDPGQAAKDVADILERGISHSLDAYDFDSGMRSVLWDAYVTGRGVSRVRYVPYLQPGGDPSQATESEPAEAPATEGMEPAEPGEVVAYEEVRCEYVNWRHFRRGPGYTWDDVPWIAFEHFLTREQLRDLAPAVAEDIQLDCSVETEDPDKGEQPKSDIEGRARVWEIWDKEQGKVLFIAPSYTQDAIREEDDPLELDGFFPIPRPLIPLVTPGKLVPMCPYEAYKDLAEELNEITRRIQNIVKALRVKGFYATSAQELEAITLAGDNELVPLQGLEAFIQGIGLDKMIAWWPIEPAVKALAQLYQQREQVKETIYEVTGLSDILRGSTQASETATAQQIKSQWGSLRIQRMQADVARYARDLFRMKAEIIAKRFAPQTIALMTGVQLTPESEALLRSDVLRSYKIDIESDSTIRADLTRNQQNMSEFVMGTANYIAAVAPAIESGIIPPDLAVEIYTSFSRNFKLGKQVEDALDRAAQSAREQAQQPQQQKPDPKMIEAQQKAELAQQQMQMQAQMEAQKLQLEQQKAQAEFGLKQQQLEADIAMQREKHAADLQMAQQKHASDVAMQRERFSADTRMNRNKMILDYKVKKQTAKGAPVEDDVANAEMEDPMAEAMKPVADSVLQLGQLMAQQNAEAAARQEQMMQAMAQMMAMVAAPKKIIRGRGGQVEGVAPDLGNGMMQ